MGIKEIKQKSKRKKKNRENKGKRWIEREKDNVEREKKKLFRKINQGHIRCGLWNEGMRLVKKDENGNGKKNEWKREKRENIGKAFTPTPLFHPT